jgi:hypothetical protein
MSKFFKIDGKLARQAIGKGEYLDFLLVVNEVSNRKIIYVYDSNTYELIDTFNSISKALKTAKINFYTLKSFIESGKSHQGKIYSYKDKL